MSQQSDIAKTIEKEAAANGMDTAATLDYIDRVWFQLKKLTPGRYIVINKWCEPETRTLFVETIKLYMCNDPENTLEFSDDYSQLKKLL